MTLQDLAKQIGQAKARDVIDNGLPRRWRGVRLVDLTELGLDSTDWKEVEVLAREAFKDALENWG